MQMPPGVNMPQSFAILLAVSMSCHSSHKYALLDWEGVEGIHTIPGNYAHNNTSLLTRPDSSGNLFSDRMLQEREGRTRMM